MELDWGLEDNTKIDGDKRSSGGYKLVPWLSWEEWDFVRESLFSSSPQSVASALSRISAWRSRGCLPVVIEVTASVIEIQQKDPYFREDLNLNHLHSEEMLSMLYCMAIMRLVNGVVEKTRKRTEISIAEAADMIGIPRMLIDIRHEGSHRDLPSLRLLRIASVKALDWLKFYYWEPQRETAAFHGDGITKIREEIKSKLHEMLFCLKMKGTPESSPSLVKGKRSKKQIMKMMKNLVLLYTSFSSELVSILLEYLLEASDMLGMAEDINTSHDGTSTIDNSLTVSNDWKLVITKFSKKEPKLLLALLKAVLDMIQAQNNKQYEIGERNLVLLKNTAENHQIEHLSSLFAWLVSIHKAVKPSRKKSSPYEKNEDRSEDPFASRENLTDLIRKCLLVSVPSNDHLTKSVLHLAKNTGNKYLIEKLNKLSSLASPNIGLSEKSPELKSEDFPQQEKYLRKAAENLELLKIKKQKRGSAETKTDSAVEKSNKWVVAKSWNACPIGMLPRTVGLSGRLPVLDSCDEHARNEITESTQKREEVNKFGKREANRSGIEILDNSNSKKLRKTVNKCEPEIEDVILSDGVKGQLMINGVWRNIGQEEINAISSAIRILV